MSLKKRGAMIILSSPSGAGKTTLVKLISKNNNLYTSVSHTTRSPRTNEVDGIDYFFVNKKKFQNLINEDQFLEYAKVFNNYYGTSKSSVNQITENNLNVLFDIDWQGSQQLRKYKELNLLTIFILPPSKEELKKRLIARNQDDTGSIEKRLLAYANDIKHAKEYNHVLVNDNVEKCFNQIKNIIKEN